MSQFKDPTAEAEAYLNSGPRVVPALAELPALNLLRRLIAWSQAMFIMGRHEAFCWTSEADDHDLSKLIVLFGACENCRKIIEEAEKA